LEPILRQDLRSARPLSGRARVVLCLAGLMWFGLVGVGLWALWGYKNTPGVAAASPHQWPASSQIRPTEHRSTLVMLAHPHCPCTRASLGQLASIMAHSQGRLNAFVLFIKRAGAAPDWEQTDLRQKATAIPGVEVIYDDDGHEARLFNAATSGQVVLYGPNGQLLFSGGITSARGHFGDNAGENSIISFVNQGNSDLTETSVFGCPLFDPQSECRTSIDDGKNQ